MDTVIIYNVFNFGSISCPYAYKLLPEVVKII